MIEDIFLKGLPQLDLHGYDRESAKVAISDFILENLILGKNKLIIIHGKGQGILKSTVKDVLDKDKRIKTFYIGAFNNGITIVELK